MPQIDLDPKNKRESGFDFPKLYLERGERARVVILQEKPFYEWVHTLQAVITSGGEVVTRERQREDGTSYRVPETEFIGRNICLGSPDVLDEKGLDPDNCPVCEASRVTDAVVPPEIRFAAMLIRYNTEPGGWEVSEPFGVRPMGWSFTQRRFNELIDIRTEHGDLRARDLLLGPCDSKQFQKFDVKVAGKAAYLENEDRKKIVQETWNANQNRDITFLIGRKATREQMEDQLSQVLDRYNQAYGKGSTIEEPDTSDSADIDDILSSGSEEEAVVSEESSDSAGPEELDLDDIFGSD